MEQKEEEIFLGRIITGGRVTIPDEVREKLDLKHGNLVKIRIKKEVNP